MAKAKNNLSVNFNNYLSVFRTAKRGVDWADVPAAKAAIDAAMVVQGVPAWYSSGITSVYAKWRGNKSSANATALDATLGVVVPTAAKPVFKAPVVVTTAAPVASAPVAPAGLKLTKAGKIDRRTIAGRAALAAGVTVPPQGPSPVAAPASESLTLEDLQAQVNAKFDVIMMALAKLG